MNVEVPHKSRRDGCAHLKREDLESAGAELSPHLKKFWTQAFKQRGREGVKQAVERYCGPDTASKKFLVALLNAECDEDGEVLEVKQPSTMTGELNVRQDLEEAPVVNLTREQDGMLKVEQGLEEAPVEKPPMEQDGEANVKQGTVIVHKAQLDTELVPDAKVEERSTTEVLDVKQRSLKTDEVT